MPQIIALDWGTTSLRAWCLDEGGNVLHFRSGGDGITQISDHNFENELYRMVGEWMDRYPEAILMACGMIGSRNGWSEVPYASCPAGKKQLVDGLEALPLKGGRSLYLIPGVCLDESLRTDIMRGEETQIIGALKGWREGVAVLPGTHCKWAKVKDGEITSFSTYLTGELFAAIKKATLIGTMVHESIDMAAFTQSVERAISGDAGVLNPLFALRSDTICGRQSEDVVAAKLSGLLIGTEIAEATRRYGKPEKVSLIGDSRLCSLYETALHAADIEAVCCDDDVAAQGIFSIASNLLNPVGASC